MPTPKEWHRQQAIALQAELSVGNYIPDPAAGYIPNPAWLGKDGRFGFSNGGEYQGEGSHGGRTVAILGDSLIVKGHLAREMQRLLPKDKIYYIGIPGYNTAQELYYYEHFIKLRPDILVLSFCLNDFSPSLALFPKETSAMFPLKETPQGPTIVNPWLYLHFAIYRLATFLLVARDLSKNPLPVEKETSVEKSLLSFREKIRAQGSRFLVLVYPMLLPSWKSSVGEYRYQAILAILRRLKIDFLDLSADLMTDPPRFREYSDDPVHPSQEGHQIAARKLASLLQH